MSKPTTYLQRFKDALALLCSKAVPDGMAEAWLANENESLQDFACSNTPLRWSQGIVVIDAAQLLADTPEEGYGHFYDKPGEGAALSLEHGQREAIRQQQHALDGCLERLAIYGEPRSSESQAVREAVKALAAAAPFLED